MKPVFVAIEVLQARLLHLDPDAWDDFIAAVDEPDTDAMVAVRTRATRWDGPADSRAAVVGGSRS